MKKAHFILIFSGLAILVLLIAPFLGATPKVGEIEGSWYINPGSMSGVLEHIFYEIRIPRVLTAFAVGAALSVSGLAFQTLFRSDLAAPFTLGVSSGAAFGASLVLSMALPYTILRIIGPTIGAAIGALIAISIVYFIITLKKNFSPASMLLAGIAVNFFFSSLLMFVQYLSDAQASQSIVFWLMGGLNYADYPTLYVAAGAAVLVLGTMLAYAPCLNQLLTGDELALSRGVNVEATRKILFIIVSITVAAVISVCGPIGFVGLMIPHICRLIVGSDHRYLIPVSFLVGGTYLTLCDTALRLLIVQLPVGVLTSLLGGPFFLYLLIRKK